MDRRDDGPLTAEEERLSEWLEEADTFETTPGAFPELEEEDETTPRRALCAECLSPSQSAGAAPVTPAEWAVLTGLETCLRGEKWAWCARRGRLSFWMR